MVVWLFQRTLSLLIDVEFFYLDSFVVWFWLANIISMVATAFMLTYYYYKQYWLTFFSLAFVAVAGICQLIIFYLVLENNRALEPYYFFATYISLGATILYATSLICSEASKNAWLKRAGVLLLTVGLILVTTEVCSVMLHNTQAKVVYQKIQMWAPLFTDVITVLFILNFANEQQLLKSGNVDGAASPKSLQSLLAILSVACLVFTVTLAAMLTQQTGWVLAWRGVGIEKAVELAKPFEPRTFVENKGDTLRYRFMKPLNYDAKKKYPLVLCLAAEF